MFKQQQSGPAIKPTAPQLHEPLVVVLAGRRTIIDFDVLAPLLWGSEDEQLATVALMRGRVQS